MNVHSNSEKGGWSVDAVWLFYKKEYLISCNVKGGLLTLEVEEQLTADRWKAQFEAKRRCLLKLRGKCQRGSYSCI